MRVSFSRLQLNVITVLVPLFIMSFFLESIGKYYAQDFYIKNSTLYARSLFWIMSFLFILIACAKRQRAPKIAIYTAVVLLLYSGFGLIVGVGRGFTFGEMLSHLSHNIGAIVIILSTSMMSFIESRDLQRFLDVLVMLILIVSAFIIISVFSQISTAIHVSLTINALALPFVSSLVRYRPVLFFTSSLMILLTIKRGLWLAAIVTVVLSYPKKTLLAFGVVGVVIIVGRLVIGEDSIIWQLLMLKFSAEEAATLDALSSGRLGILLSLHHALQINNAFLTGLGFGAVFDAGLYNSGAEWVTNGVDVSIAHFWFLYGYIFGSIFFCLYTYISIVPMVWARRTSDLFLNIMSKASVFLYIASLSTFVAWEPLHWVVIGLCLARRSKIISSPCL